MATTYTSTIEVNVWKEHTCVGCGQNFRYLFKRKKKGTGGTEAAASAAAQNAVVKALARETDMHPCPGCGLYQPDMIAARRAVAHWWLFGAALVAFPLLVILYATDVLSATLATVAGLVVGVIVVVGHFLADRTNANRDLESNQRLAQARVRDGDLWEGKPGAADAEGENPGSGWTSAHSTAYAVLVVALLALAAPILLRVVRGWPVNGSWYPEVVGPGDEAYVYFPTKITTVKGYWKGRPHAQIANAAEFNLANPTLKATSQNDTWGEKISIGSKESKESTKSLWVRVVLPPNPELAGKTVDLDLKLDVEFPQLRGNEWFPATSQSEHRSSIQLASPGAGKAYKSAWWWGMCGGAALILFLSFWLARLADSFRHRALPTNVYVPGQEPEAVEDVPAAELAPEEEGNRIRPAGE
jgi:hypothetical protein